MLVCLGGDVSLKSGTLVIEEPVQKTITKL